MTPKAWYVCAALLGLLIGTNAWLAWRYGDRAPLRVVVVASHRLPGNHKITADDLDFVVRRVAAVNHPLGRPAEAVGACTVESIGENEIVDWQQLAVRGTGDSSCASTAMALQILKQVIQSPVTPAPHNAGPPLVASLWWMDVGHDLPSRMSPEAESALGEFRAEFMKEFAKRIADNAADHAFGRDRKEPTSAAPRIPPRASTKVETVVYFDTDRYHLDQRQHDTLTRFAKNLRQYNECNVMITPFTDGTGSRELNQRLASQRANAIVDVLVSEGVSRDIIKVTTNGSLGQGATSTAPQSSFADRRAEIQGHCR
jgi:outer membrane protein OmpA-like peptidoglycan-associated protein